MAFVTGYCASLLSFDGANSTIILEYNTTNIVSTNKSNCDWAVSVTTEFLESQNNYYFLESQPAAVSSDYQLNIDSEIYTTVSGWILFSFVSGHALGRILKALGRR
ncbi:hypothetical protein EK599_19590 [Vibrio sp. T187]|uniref:hypothetical protein n=1 Tax=Vibrio TaxID=662 RepID=UPI0010C94D15|nr:MULTISPECIES: hypothetical protein [Vibrio]MBW3697891.1 hypothetical protein [Vibrio sp. T187]